MTDEHDIQDGDIIDAPDTYNPETDPWQRFMPSSRPFPALLDHAFKRFFGTRAAFSRYAGIPEQTLSGWCNVANPILPQAASLERVLGFFEQRFDEMETDERTREQLIEQIWFAWNVQRDGSAPRQAELSARMVRQMTQLEEQHDDAVQDAFVDQVHSLYRTAMAFYDEGYRAGYEAAVQDLKKKRSSKSRKSEDEG